MYPKSADFKCTKGAECFKIDINESSFTYIPYLMNLLDDSNIAKAMVSDKNGVRYQGAIVSFKHFSGEITVQNSVFTNNKAPYDHCISADYLLRDPASGLPSVNNFRQLINNSAGVLYNYH